MPPQAQVVTAYKELQKRLARREFEVSISPNGEYFQVKFDGHIKAVYTTVEEVKAFIEGVETLEGILLLERSST